MGQAPSRLQSALGLGSQLVNAGTNVATVYVASLLLRPDAFGAFVLGFAAVTLTLATGRGLICASMLTQIPSLPDEAERRRTVRSSFGFSILVGLAGSALLLVVALWTPSVVWFVPWLLVALLHDVARHVVIALGDRTTAFVLDVVWAGAQGLCLVILWASGAPLSVATLAVAWGVGATAGFVVFVVRAGSWVLPTGPGLWIRSTRDIAGWFTLISAFGQFELYVVLLLAGVLLSDADAGGLRAVQLLVFQPPLVMCGALLTLILPGIAQAGADTARLSRTWRRALLTVAPVGAAVLVVAAFGDTFMDLLFPQYTGYGPLVLPVALQATAILLSVPTSALLMGTRRGRLEFTLHTARTTMIVVGAVAGAVLAGPVGLAWGLAVASASMLVMMTVVARRELRRGVPDVPDGDERAVPPAVPGTDVPGRAVSL